MGGTPLHRPLSKFFLLSFKVSNLLFRLLPAKPIFRLAARQKAVTEEAQQFYLNSLLEIGSQQVYYINQGMAAGGKLRVPAPSQPILITHGEMESPKLTIGHSDDFQKLYMLVHQFWEIVNERKKDQLNAWLSDANNSGIVELKNFAQDLEKDLKAIEAALAYEWSNGPVEGHNNRLKMIKRQVYGRAKFDLLRQRVLYTT